MKVIDLGIACVASVPLRFSGVGVERAKVGTRAETEQREQAGGGGGGWGGGRRGGERKKRKLPLLSPPPSPFLSPSSQNPRGQEPKSAENPDGTVDMQLQRRLICELKHFQITVLHNNSQSSVTFKGFS